MFFRISILFFNNKMLKRMWVGWRIVGLYIFCIYHVSLIFIWYSPLWVMSKYYNPWVDCECLHGAVCPWVHVRLYACVRKQVMSRIGFYTLSFKMCACSRSSLITHHIEKNAPQRKIWLTFQHYETYENINFKYKNYMFCNKMTLN